MSRSLVSLATLALTATPALADLGHMLDQGHGHVHWDDLLIIAAIGAALIGYGLSRLYRHRHRRRA
jgi:hypothetical protein